MSLADISITSLVRGFLVPSLVYNQHPFRSCGPPAPHCRASDPERLQYHHSDSSPVHREEWARVSPRMCCSQRVPEQTEIWTTTKRSSLLAPPWTATVTRTQTSLSESLLPVIEVDYGFGRDDTGALRAMFGVSNLFWGLLCSNDGAKKGQICPCGLILHIFRPFPWPRKFSVAGGWLVSYASNGAAELALQQIHGLCCKLRMSHLLLVGSSRCLAPRQIDFRKISENSPETRWRAAEKSTRKLVHDWKKHSGHFAET